ncbi:MAG: alkaline phosphatase family protein [Candidatus Sulfotelmatobacter sp.]
MSQTNNINPSARSKTSDISARNNLDRREFLKKTAALTGGALALSSAGSLFAKSRVLPKPNKSGVDHIVLVTMENRSFDHFLGWLPGANGMQAGLSFADTVGNTYPTYALTDYQGCGHADPDHSYSGGRVEYDGGKCDGFLKRAPVGDQFPIGYYGQSDLAFLGQAAPGWTTFSNYFAAIMAETFPNRIYQHAAQTDRIDNSTTISTLPTIWDRLADHSISRRYYFSDIPLLALWGSKYLSISAPVPQFFADCAAGTLPHVSVVEPRFLGESQGLSNDDHPFADIRNGEVFLNSVYMAVTSSPVWRNTVLIINFDEWGGFFEHVPPPRAPIPAADAIAGNQDGLRGFRVPCLIISPKSPRGSVVSGVYDHTSILKMIEWRWNVRPLTVRDATAQNLALALDFSLSDLTAPQYAIAPGSFGSVCTSTLRTPSATTRSAGENWDGLRNIALRYGWPVA